MATKGKTLARGITRKLFAWLVVIVVVASYFVFSFANWATREFYSENYHNRTLIIKEYTRRVLSDVYVAVTNNIYYLEQNLDNPDFHKDVMERIVRNGTRVRSCGISFIGDYYYPKKEHHFCAFAWRNPRVPDVIEKADMGDAAFDYLTSDWFLNVVNNDSAYWSDPFYDGYDEKTTLAAYMVPIHDQEGRVVAVLGADISLDWLTYKLHETDSIVNANAPFASKILQQTSRSYLINHDGTFITHPDEERILKDNIFNYVDENQRADARKLLEKVKAGSEQLHDQKFLINGKECYIFYTPVKYTEWTMVTVVPWQSIDMLGIFNGSMLLLFIVVVMLIFIVISYFCMKRATKPLRQFVNVANDIARRKFDTPLPQVDEKGELRQLSESFEHIQESLSCSSNK